MGTGENGRDMIWNPTSNVVTEEFPFIQQMESSLEGKLLLGGKHFVYVIGEIFGLAEDDYLSGDLYLLMTRELDIIFVGFYFKFF